MALLSSYFSDSNHVSNEIHDPKSMHPSDLVVSANVLSGYIYFCIIADLPSVLELKFDLTLALGISKHRYVKSN